MAVDCGWCNIRCRCRGVVCRGKSGLKKLLDVKRSTRNRLKYSFIEYDCCSTNTARSMFLRSLLLTRSWLILPIRGFEFCHEEGMIPVTDLERESRGRFEKSTWS